MVVCSCVLMSFCMSDKNNLLVHSSSVHIFSGRVNQSKATQARREHANSKSKWPPPGIEHRTFLLSNEDSKCFAAVLPLQ